jgi:hypothetical protein
MVVLLIEDLPRSLAFYRRLDVEFPPDADQRTDIQVPIGDDRQLVLTATFERNVPDNTRRVAGRASSSSSSSTGAPPWHVNPADGLPQTRLLLGRPLDFDLSSALRAV